MVIFSFSRKHPKLGCLLFAYTQSDYGILITCTLWCSICPQSIVPSVFKSFLNFKLCVPSVNLTTQVA